MSDVRPLFQALTLQYNILVIAWEIYCTIKSFDVWLQWDRMLTTKCDYRSQCDYCLLLGNYKGIQDIEIN